MINLFDTLQTKNKSATVSKDERYWFSVVNDLQLFRVGKFSREQFKEKYPDFHVWQGWCQDGAKEAMRITIPKDCPLPMVAKIMIESCHKPKDVGLVDPDIQMAYQPAWAELPQIGELKQLCTIKKNVVFRTQLHQNDSYYKQSYIEMRYCIAHGSYGGDGYGIEPDTWLMALLKEDGTWLKEWYIED